jgi:hypothetical protein
MDEPNPATFDLAAVFANRSFAKDVITVFFDEETAYEYHKLTREAVIAARSEDEDDRKRIEKRREELQERANKVRYDLHLTGVSRQDKKNLLDEVLEKYPLEYDTWGRIKPNEDADEMNTDGLWLLHIEKIADPSGAEKKPELEDIKLIRQFAPDAELKRISDAIRDLADGSKSGFESIVQEHDFLSRASQKA